MADLSVHSEKGCILFLNADIDNASEAGKVTRVSEQFLKQFGANTKDEVIGQNMKMFVTDEIRQVH
jgi:hypothetical protein